MISAPFASAGQRSAVECVVPWTDEARYDAALFDSAFEMLAETSRRFRVWLAPMTSSERGLYRFDAAIESLRRYPQAIAWNGRGQTGLDRLHATLDRTSPGAIRVVADFSEPFRAADLAEALTAGKRRATAFGLAAKRSLLMSIAAPEAGVEIRVDAAQQPLLARPPIVVESETGGRRLRPVGNIRKIRSLGAT